MRRRNAVTGIAISVAALLLLAVAACGDDATSTPVVVRETVEVTKEVVVTQEVEVTKEVVVTQEVEVTKEVVVIATPTPKPAPELSFPSGSLRIALPALPGTATDPAQSRFSQDKKYFELMYDSLIGAVPGTSQFSTETGLAQNWEFSAGGLSLTLTLRDGVTFHNGDPLTPADVKFTLERLAEDFAEEQNVEFLTSTISAIELPGQNQVVLKLATTSLSTLFALSSIDGNSDMVVPKAYLESIGQEAFIDAPVGTGPYKFLNRSGGARIAMEAIDDHWFVGTPRWKSVEFTVVPEETTRLAMLQTDAISIATIRRGSVEAAESAGLEIFGKPGAVQAIVQFHQQWRDIATNDERVRRAVALGIDFETILETILAGRGDHVWTFFPSAWDFAYDPNLMTPYDYDPAEARSILEEAGMLGTTIHVQSYPRGDIPELTEVAEAIAGMLDEVGFDAQIVSQDIGAWVDKLRGQSMEDPSISVMGGSNRPLAAGLIATLLWSEGGFAQVMDPDLDALIEDVNSAQFVDDYKAAVQEVFKLVKEKTFALPAFQLDDLRAVQPGIFTVWDVGGREPASDGLRWFGTNFPNGSADIS